MHPNTLRLSETEADIAAYLNAPLEDDTTSIAAALDDITRTKEITQLARETGIARDGVVPDQINQCRHFSYQTHATLLVPCRHEHHLLRHWRISLHCFLFRYVQIVHICVYFLDRGTILVILVAFLI